MSELSIQEMINVGAHYGHQTKRWNPKMKPFIYGTYSGVHILDLQQTYYLAQKAFEVIEDIVARGENILFVGTKTQARSVIEEQATRAQMPYIKHRWLGGMLTNFQTIRKSVLRLLDLEDRREKNDFAGYTKKERLDVDREIEKLEATLGGIKNMRKPPAAIFVVDPNIEKIAIHEAKILGIPIIAIADSNCNPDPIDYIIPANDDAQRCIQAFATQAADACLRGLEKREMLAREDQTKSKEESQRKISSRKAQAVEKPGQAYVSKADAFDDKEQVESFSATVEDQPQEPAIIDTPDSEKASEV